MLVREAAARAGQLVYKALIEKSRQAIESSLQDDIINKAAALAFYAILSAAPLLVVLLAIADSLWGREAALAYLMGQLSEYIGPNTTQLLQDAVANSRVDGEIQVATIVSGVFLLFSSTLLFAQLRESLAIIWKIPEPKGAVRIYFKQRGLALLVIVFSGGLLLLTSVASPTLGVIRETLTSPLPTIALLPVDWLSNWLWFNLLIIVHFRALAGRRVAWRLVVIMSIVASSLLLLGNKLIALYLSTAAATSAYGTAGSLATLALWVYYCSIAVFFAAEYARVWVLPSAEDARSSDPRVEAQSDQ